MDIENSNHIILAAVAPWIIGLGLLVALLSLLLNGMRPAASWADWLTPLVMLGGGLVGWVLTRRDRSQAGVLLFAGSIWLTIVLYILATGQGIFNEAFIFLLVPILIVGMFVSWVGGLVIALCSIIFVLGVSTAVLSAPTSLDPYRVSLSYILLYIIGITTSYTITLSAQYTAQTFKTLDNKRQQSEAKYRRLAEVSPVGIFQLNWRGECTFVNQRWSEISGYTTEEAMGHGWHKALHPDDREWVIRGASVYSSDDGTLFSERFRYRQPDGQTVWVIGNVSVERDEHGRVVNYVGTITDITNEENALIQLREREQIYSYLVNTVADGVSIADADNRYIYVNDQHCAIIGYEREELLGFEVQERLKLDQENKRLIKAEREKRRQGNRSQYELSWVNGRGRLTTVIINAGPLHDDHGNFTGTLSIMTDITERKQAEMALQKNEQLYRTLVETMNEGVAIQDEKTCYTYVNNQHCRLLGATREELLGQTPEAILTFSPEQRKLLHQQKANRQKGQEDRYELTFTRRDGVEKTALVAARPLFAEDGRPVGSIIISSDITERVRAEQALRQTQKLESLGILAGGVAHDFNNLLVAMLGQSSLAMHKLDKGQPVQAQLQKIHTAAERAADLTKQLLAYSGQGHFQVRPLDLNQMIRENLHLFAVAMPPHVRLKSDLEEGLPPIEADAGQMQQIIMNLIINGAEACRPLVTSEAKFTGQVTVRTRTMQMTASDIADMPPGFTAISLQPGQYVCLMVRDNGSGMSAKTLNKIFDPFFTTKPTGRGLGLAAVLGIVRGHQGELFVDSTPDEGTKFEVLLPIKEHNQPWLLTHDFRTDGQDLPRTVLIIDDEPAVREAAADILEEAGVEILLAADGQAGLALYRENTAVVDLILLDLTMPGLNGEETLHALRHLTPNLRIVLSSGYNQIDLSQHLLQQRHTSFLPKPYTAAALIHALQETA